MADEKKLDGRTKAGRAAIETKDVEPPKASTVMMESDVATEDIDRPDLVVITDESVNSPVVKEYMADLKFMEDIIEFSISPTTDKNAENPVPCGVNGVVHHIPRGKRVKLARKFVDSLIKREDAVQTVNYKDKDGVDQTKIEKTPAMKYPLSIHNDPAGEVGTRWFEHQIRNAW